MTWDVKPLADVVELRRGFDLPTSDRVPGEFPVISAGKQIGTHHEAKVDGPGFAVGRATNLGVPQWSDQDYWPLNTTLYAASFKGNNPRWLFHLFQMLDLTGFNSGSVQPMLNRNYIAQVQVRVPPRRTQDAIGEVLGALDNKIAANRRVIGSSVALATQIVAREAFGPDRQLSEIADVQMGSSPRGADLNEDGDGMEFYQGVRDFGPLSPTPRVFATVTPRRANAGDTLLAVRAPVGEVNWARNETCIGRGLAAVRAVGTPTTIHYLLKRFASRWDEHEGSGTVFSSVTGPQVKGMRFPTVPEASAEDVEQVVASIHHRALSAEAESEVLARTRDELLPLLMNGRISVKDAERVVGDVM